ncbi:hypothetical protein CSHISOI_11660, partial [Colletotrichum shisoi]
MKFLNAILFASLAAAASSRSRSSTSTSSTSTVTDAPEETKRPESPCFPEQTLTWNTGQIAGSGGWA